jgi:hypothetical protein
MMKSIVLVQALFLICSYSFCQKTSYIQPTTIGIHFTFTDFETAIAIRNTSLSTVLREKKFGKLQNMWQGLAISYGKGLSENFDFSSMLIGSFLAYPKSDVLSSGSESLLLEADASIKGKLMSDKYWFVPYLQVGVGASRFKNYWGTFIPAGLGIQINFFGEAYLVINSQYRIAVTETTNYHFMHSIGLVGNIGKMVDRKD